MSIKRQGASVIVVNSDRQVLLYLRDDKAGIRYPNCWDLLGGNVEAGESAEECIKRELREEIELDLGTPQLFNTYDMGDRIEHTFWVELELEIERTPLHEGQRLQWFSEREVSQLPDEKVGFGFKPILLDFFRQKSWEV